MGIDILTLAAAMAGKGGGSASKYKQPDWGAEMLGLVELLPNTELTVMEEVGAALLMQEVNLTEGNVYTVNFNGTEYNCTAVYQEGMTGVSLGNVGAMLEGMPVTDDPFIFVAISEEFREEIAGACAMAVPLDGSTTFTLSIKEKNEEIHKIPVKYVERVPFEPLVVNVSQINGTNSVLTHSFAEIYDAIESGRTVFVEFNEYRYLLASCLPNDAQFVHLGPLTAKTEVDVITIARVVVTGDTMVTRSRKFLTLSEV